MRHPIALLPVLGLCLVRCVPMAVRAQETVLIVTQQEDDGFFTTISAALDAIPDEMAGPYVIEIRDDETYEEQVKVNVNSSASATLTIRPGVGNTPAIQSDKNKKPALKISSPFVTVEGLTLLGRGQSSGVHLDWADDVTVRDCDIRDAEGGPRSGVYIQGAQRALITDNTIRDNGVGILVFDAEDGGNTIRNNRIYNNRVRGIWIYKGSANTSVLNNTLYHNQVEIHLGKGNKKNDEPGEGNIFRNNILVAHENDGYGVRVNMKDAQGLPAGTVFDYNLYHTEDGGTRVARFRNQDMDTLVDWQSAMGVDGQSLQADPLLVSAPSDLHPQSTTGSYHEGSWTADASHSPAIDAGDPAAAFADEPDPDGGRVNIGAYGGTVEASLAAAPVAAVPTGEISAASQGTDGTGAVAVSIVANHATGADVQAKVEWSDAENGTYQKATLSGPVTASADDSGGPPGLDNGADYQLGAGGDTRIVTSAGSNTVSFTWSSAADAPTAEGTYWLRLTVNDGETDQETPALQQLALDNVAPVGLDSLQVTDLTGTSLVLTWLAATESNFAGYKVWYGTDQTDVEGRTGGAAIWASTSWTRPRRTATGAARGFWARQPARSDATRSCSAPRWPWLDPCQASQFSS
ncbi:MAG TPA: right-handed parallel beta-helix repeat-containing protein [Candidatus Latescibacteria bacterium]|nr:right-handed parallel beta-helix repeat-containing protein [Candidatus Latescibacterota bacterium]